MRFKCLITCCLLLLGAQMALSQDATPSTDPSPTATSSGYGALLETEIRGLSPETIEGYRTGKGMSLALPAELNGYPGSRHVLDFSEELELTDTQYTEVEDLYNDMLAEAIPLGEKILVAEAELELAFREKTITDSDLEARLLAIGALQADLRFVHLRTHIATYYRATEINLEIRFRLSTSPPAPLHRRGVQNRSRRPSIIGDERKIDRSIPVVQYYALLTPVQIETYNILRGYTAEDENTHQGHAGHS